MSAVADRFYHSRGWLDSVRGIKDRDDVVTHLKQIE
jgi:hypothetical protein